MSAEKAHKDNSGVLFPNGAKWRAEKPGRPNFGGECTVAGRRLRLAAWERQTEDGRPFLSLAFSEPQKGGAK